MKKAEAYQKALNEYWRIILTPNWYDKIEAITKDMIRVVDSVPSEQRGIFYQLQLEEYERRTAHG